MMNQTLHYDTEKPVVALAQRGDEPPMAVTPGNGTSDWIASFYDVGKTNRRRGVIETHNETMVDEASLECWTFTSLTTLEEMDEDTLVRRLLNEA